MANRVPGVWVATLDRYGYTLLVVERSAQKAREAMAAEYTRAYFRLNAPAYDTAEEMAEADEEFKEYFSGAMQDIYCRKLEYGKVEWC